MSEEKGNYAVTVIDPAAVMPVLNIETALQRRSNMVEFVSKIMRENEDYGVIPGTNDKKTLLKAGAEKLTTFFGLTKRFSIIEKIEDFNKPLFYYLYRCSLYRGDLLIAEADGSCSSHESKYRYRKTERVCPNCGKSAIIKGKNEYGGGWICYAKKGGCGAKFQDGDKNIEGQSIRMIENPDVADQANTILKMAQKRALVAATLLAVNASEFFTQDMEDFVDGEIIHGEEMQTNPKPETKNRAKTETERLAMYDAFLARVIDEISYYRHEEHVKNTLKQLGYKAYNHAHESEMLAKLQEHANLKANEQSAKEGSN